MRNRYLAEGQEAYAGAPVDEDDEHEEGPADPGTDPWSNQQLDDEGNPVGTAQYAGGPRMVPGMVGVTPDMLQEPLPPEQSATPPSSSVPNAPPAPWWKDLASKALNHPGSNVPVTGTGEVPTMAEAAKSYEKVLNQYPQRQAPNWIERVAAGALGAAAGYSNAARRAAPIDIGKVTEGVLYPGYEGKLAAWQSRVVPAQQQMEIAGQQAAAGWKGQQINSEMALKQAQAEMNIKRGNFYDNANRLMEVTPAAEAASNGILKANTKVPYATIQSELNRVAARKAVVSPTDLYSQAMAMPGMDPNNPEHVTLAREYAMNGGKLPPPKPVGTETEAHIKDQQIRADYATAVGKDPAGISDAEMNAARRMFGSGDPLITSSMREFVFQKKRLPNPAEERQIVSRAVDQKANAKIVPGNEIPAPLSPPPSGPASGATKLVNGVPYQFDGTVWRKQAMPGAK